jgi:hypothetical protein
MRYVGLVWYIFFSLYLFSIQAMEKAVEPCYLTLLPVDVCNRIAYFLPWESKEDFIKRTKEIEALPASWVHSLPIKKNDCTWQEPLRVLSPDKNKMATIELFHHDGAKATLTIINSNQEKIYDGFIPYELYQQIALSQSGDMLATFQKKKVTDYYKNVLTIQKIIEGRLEEIKNIVLPDGFDSMALAFNTQDTHLIVRGINCTGKQEPRKMSYKILRLENSKKKPLDYHYALSVLDEKNLLQNYLRRCMVCKKY